MLDTSALRTMVLATCAVLLFGCNDSTLRVAPTPQGGPPDQGDDDDDSTEPPDPEEICNGQDDDGDGEVDEGFADTDGDGIADCIDSNCDIDWPDVGEVPVDEQCMGDEQTLTTDPWNIVTEWQWTGLSTDSSVNQVIMTPVAGNLTDDNGDGVIDEADIPDIAFVAYSGWQATGFLIALSGDTGQELFALSGYAGYGGIAMADVSGDGVSDVIGFTGSNSGAQYARAVDNTGATLWTSSTANYTYAPQATVANLDASGSPEVIADEHVLNGQTGALIATIPVSGSILYRMPAVGDIDLDGEQEVLLGEHCWSLSQGIEWSTNVIGTYGHWWAILDQDGDPEAEVAVVGGGQMAIHDDDGTVLVSEWIGSGQPGTPCVADFDGDTEAEIGWASSGTFQVLDLDGTQVWSAAVTDFSGLAGCSGYDFNGDLQYEVLFADETTAWVFDGATGAVLHSTAGHTSATIWEYPIVADIDNDGSAEIVFASNGSTGAITVLGHVNDAWAKSGTTWHTHDFAVTNINPDGTVPVVPTPSWQAFNVYRARPLTDNAVATPDLRVAITDACWSGCEPGGIVQLMVQVENGGGAATGAEVSIALYGISGPSTSLIDVATLNGPLMPGEQSGGVLFLFDPTEAGSDGLLVRVDDLGEGAGAISECDEGNNEATWNDTPCP